MAAIAFLAFLPLAAIEEISMRGFVLPAAGRSFGKWGGLIASSLVFALMHGFNPHFSDHPLTIPGLLLAGLFLGSAYLITERLWFPIFLHACWNWMEGPIFGFPVSGTNLPVGVFEAHDSGPSLWTGGTFGPEAGLLLCLLLTVYIGVLWVLKPYLRTPETFSDRDSAGTPTPAPAPRPAAARAIPLD